jgi:diguanylate cyclase (GGDEF)-like protein
VVVRGLGTLLVGALFVYALHVQFGLGGSGVDWLFNDFVYNGLILGSALACVLRAVLVPEERLAWAVMALGLASWTGGELYWTLVLSDLDSPPYPSPGDALYLGLYPCAYVTLVLLIRARVTKITPSQWLDGAIGGVAIAAVAASAALGTIVDTTEGELATVATNLAYPLGDLLLLSLVIGVIGVCGWRPGRAWLFIGLGLVAMAIADGVFLFQSAEGTYVEGTLLDAGWPASALLIAASAWVPAERREHVELEGLRMIIVPTLCALIGLGVLVYQDFSHQEAGHILALVTMLLVTVRMALAFRENQGMLVRSRHDALTDSLTGLSNRRRLMADLDREARAASAEDPRAVVLFDLDGFKQYNDTYGHPAGDALLTRLGGRLDVAVEPYGTAYRLGGDEFCVLVRLDGAALEVISAATSAALSEHGEGFTIASSHGSVVMPAEATEPSGALQMADRRMYAEKGGRRTSAGRQTRDVLLSTLREREPELHEHLQDVGHAALAVGRHLGLTPEELDELGRAAELHDVGKIAIPDAILSKPGPLDDEEWSFMRRHTIIGERILGSAPALRPVARIVRASHERFDGEGYPDQLAGEDIPLGARIVAVCDAFHAMTSDRPYRTALSRAEALAELRRCAGSQFDPRVVDAFATAVIEGAQDQEEVSTP